ncbi:hypothetical protein J6590_004633 [Homalodisca vitripennis]|nr:hypothetical protein J6590_004633 [Homalodisca vitripennis]
MLDKPDRPLLHSLKSSETMQSPSRSTSPTFLVVFRYTWTPDSRSQQMPKYWGVQEETSTTILTHSEYSVIPKASNCREKATERASSVCGNCGAEAKTNKQIQSGPSVPRHVITMEDWLSGGKSWHGRHVAPAVGPGECGVNLGQELPMNGPLWMAPDLYRDSLTFGKEIEVIKVLLEPECVALYCDEFHQSCRGKGSLPDN